MTIYQFKINYIRNIRAYKFYDYVIKSRRDEILVAPYVAQRNAGDKKQKTKAMQVMRFQKEQTKHASQLKRMLNEN